jgi:hypothetical protein
MKATIHADVLEEEGELLATGSTLVLRKVNLSASVFVLKVREILETSQSGLGDERTSSLESLQAKALLKQTTCM